MQLQSTTYLRIHSSSKHFPLHPIRTSLYHHFFYGSTTTFFMTFLSSKSSLGKHHLREIGREKEVQNLKLILIKEKKQQK